MAQNTQSQQLGTAAPVPMGDWQASTLYLKLNIVRYNGASYMAKKQNQGFEPTVTTGWQEVWQVVVYDGLVAPTGTYPELTVGKATAAENDGAGNNIAEQFSTVADEIETLRTDFTNEEHFKGVFQSEAALKSAYPTATPNDYAYIAGGNMWIYENNGGWTNSGTPTPDSIVPASNNIPQMDGVGNAGNSNDYSKGNHVHPSDTKKANLSGAVFTGAVSAPTVTGTNGVYDGGVRVYSSKNPPPSSGGSDGGKLYLCTMRLDWSLYVSDIQFYITSELTTKDIPRVVSSVSRLSVIDVTYDSPSNYQVKALLTISDDVFAVLYGPNNTINTNYLTVNNISYVLTDEIATF